MRNKGMTRVLKLFFVGIFVGIVGGFFVLNRTTKNPIQPELITQTDDDIIQPDPAQFGLIGFCNTSSNAGAVFVRGNIAYVSEPTGLECINVSDNIHPTLLGRYNNGSSGGGGQIYVQGNIAYTTLGTIGLQIVDITNPTAPTHLGSFLPSDGQLWGVYVSGNIAYVADSNYGLFCVNVTNPKLPIVIGGYPHAGGFTSICLSGNVAYAGYQGGRLYCINISNPQDPTLITSFLGCGKVQKIEGNVLYGSDTFNQFLCINISNPAAPSVIGNYTTFWLSAFDVCGDYAYTTANFNSFLFCINVTNLANPNIIKNYTLIQGAGGVCISGNFAYVTAYQGPYPGLQILQISYSGIPTLRGSLSSTYSRKVVVNGDVAYVTGDHMLKCFDVTNPGTSYLLGTYNYGSSGSTGNVFVSGHIAYLTDSSVGLMCINVSNPTAPTLLGTYSVTYFNDVFVSGSVAYIVGGMAGFTPHLRCINVTNPASPNNVGSYSYSGAAERICVEGDVAYIIDRTYDQLYSINISNPALPTLIGSVSLIKGTDIYISGPIAYVTNGSAGVGSFQCINVTDPAAPVFLGFYDILDVVQDLYVWGNIAYIATGGGLECINVTNYAEPCFAGYCATYASAISVYIDGQYAYCGDYLYFDTIKISYYEWQIPTITDNQAGDDTWRSVAGTSYNVEFKSDITSNLSYAQYKITTAAAQGGTILKDWTNIFTGLGAQSYTTDWVLDFVICQEGTNYVSVLVNDTSGASRIFDDVFYVRMDVTNPTITDNQGGDDTWRSAAGTTYDVDFSDALSLLNYAQYKITTATGQGGTVLKDWTNIFTGLGASSYIANWVVDFTACQQGTNYVSVRVYDNAGNSVTSNDVFYVKKDTVSPSITDNQAGDTTWRSAAGTTYDVDFSDATSLLNYAQYKITTAPAQGGSLLKDWTNIFTGLGASSYTTDWTVDFSACQEGTNYVSVLVYDNVGLSSTTNDAFYVRKDTTNPTITDNQAGDDTWRNVAGTTYNVDFSDATSLLNYAQYKITTAPSQGGSLLKDWTNIFTGLGTSSYTTDWTVDFSACQEGTNYVSVRVYDYTSLSTTSNDVFYVKKDVTNPTITDNQAGDDTWRNVAGTTYNVDFSDATSLLNYAQYKITTAPAQGGSLLKDWTNIFTGLGGNSYTADWSVDFSACQDGTNYVSVRVYDYAGLSTTSSDVFYIKKDGTAPIITVNTPNGNGYSSAPTMDVDFSDMLSGLKNGYYKVDSYIPMGTDSTGWITIFTSYGGSSFTTDIPMDGVVWDALSEGSHTIYFKTWDNLNTVRDGPTYSWQFTKGTMPAAPVLQSITPNTDTDGAVVLKWDQVPLALSYKVYQYSGYITEKNSSVQLVKTVTVNGTTIENIANGVYYFVVTAVSNGGESPISNCQGVTVSIVGGTNEDLQNLITLILWLTIPALAVVTLVGVRALKKRKAMREMDKLMNTYSDWEKDGKAKKSDGSKPSPPPLVSKAGTLPPEQAPVSQPSKAIISETSKTPSPPPEQAPISQPPQAIISETSKTPSPPPEQAPISQSPKEIISETSRTPSSPPLVTKETTIPHVIAQKEEILQDTTKEAIPPPISQLPTQAKPDFQQQEMLMMEFVEKGNAALTTNALADSLSNYQVAVGIAEHLNHPLAPELNAKIQEIRDALEVQKQKTTVQEPISPPIKEQTMEPTPETRVKIPTKCPYCAEAIEKGKCIFCGAWICLACGAPNTAIEGKCNRCGKFR